MMNNKKDISILTLENAITDCKKQKLSIGLGTVHIPLDKAERLLTIIKYLLKYEEINK